MMKLEMKHFVATVTSFVAVVSLACTAFVLAAPQIAIKFFNNWMHGIDLTQIIKTNISAVDIVTGFISVVVLTAIFSAIFVFLWNYFAEKLG